MACVGMLVPQAAQPLSFLLICKDEPFSPNLAGVQPSTAHPSVQRGQWHLQFSGEIGEPPVVRIVRGWGQGPRGTKPCRSIIARMSRALKVFRYVTHMYPSYVNAPPRAGQ